MHNWRTRARREAAIWLRTESCFERILTKAQPRWHHQPSATSGRDFDPISSSCRNSSRNSKGGVTPARTTCQKKIPEFAKPLQELSDHPLGALFQAKGVGPVAGRGTDSMLAIATILQSLTRWVPDLARRADLEVHARKQGMWAAVEELQQECFGPRLSAGCSFPTAAQSGAIVVGVPCVHCRHRTCIGRYQPQRQKMRGGRLLRGALSRSKPRHGLISAAGLCTHSGNKGCLLLRASANAYRVVVLIAAMPKSDPNRLVYPAAPCPQAAGLFSCLPDAGRHCSSDDGIRPKRVKNIIAELDLLRRPHIRQVGLRCGAFNKPRGLCRICQ